MSEKTLELLKDEINLIKDPKIKAFTISGLRSAPDYFDTVASSTSGKYHPKYALGEGGLIRHVKAVVMVVRELVVAMEIENKVDYLISAALLHDIAKNGRLYRNGQFDNSEGNVTQNHGVKTAEYLVATIPDADKDVCRILSKHMGRWSPQGVRPQSKAEYCLHLADYLASRKFISIDGVSEQQ